MNYARKTKSVKKTERKLIREHKYTDDVGLWLLKQMNITRRARDLDGDELWNETLRFYKMASEEGLYAATENLIIIYENGFHFEKDFEKVEQLKKLAAEQKRDYDEKMGIKHNITKKE